MAKRYLGQNFLYDPSILKKIIEAAQLNTEDLVVEIGPGHGSLTKMLAEVVGKVIAVEIDEELFIGLKKEFAAYENVEIVHEDALKYPYEGLGKFKAVANIPYYITTPLIFRLFDARKNLESMTLTVQKEVAERIVAGPGGKDFGVLSIMVQYYAKPGLKFIIPRGAFRPVPRVDSAVVHFKILDRPSVNVDNEKLFFSLVKTAFSQRRKFLSNSLKSIREDVKEWLAKSGIDPNRRPETLSIEEFARLANSYH
jgi:16S rRNA (adenine1518-N6/adenine1519-N6)-dimethyltransferase